MYKTVIENETFFKEYNSLTLENIKLNYDNNLLKSLIKNPKNQEDNYIVDLSEDDIKELKKFQKDIKSVQCYKYKRDDGLGRVYHNTNIQFMRGILRKTLLYEFYYDLDIKCCQPTILYNLCVYHNIECKNLKEFIDFGRDNYFTNGKSKGILKEVLKQNINKLIFTASTDDPVLIPIAREISAAIFELKNIYVDIYNTSLKINEENNKTYNLEGSFLAMLLQTVENRIITICYHELKKIGIQTGLILHDSLHIKKNKKIEDLEYLCIDLKKIIKEKFYNFDITFILKDFSNETLQNHHSIKELKKTNDKLICDAFYEFYKEKSPICIVKSDIYVCNEETNLWCINEKHSFRRVFENEEFQQFLLQEYNCKINFITAYQWDSLFKYIKTDYRFVKPKDFEFDNNPRILAFLNKKCICLDKFNKEKPWYVRDLNANDYCSMSTGYNYNDKDLDINKPIELIKNCFQDQDTAESYLLILGSCIYGELLYKKFFINKGAGNNGRSFIVSNILAPSLGCYHGTFNSDFFVSVESSGDIKDPQAILNKKRRLITLNEPKSSVAGRNNFWDQEKIKLYTGNDTITVRPLNSNDISQFQNIATIIGALNVNLKFKNIGAADRERLIIIPQDTYFTDDPKLPHEKKKLIDTEFMKQDKFKNSVLQMLLLYWTKFVNNNLQLKFSKQILDETEEQFADSIDIFLKNTIESSNNKDDFVIFDDLYNKYLEDYEGDYKFIKKQKQFKETLNQKRIICKKIDRNINGERINKFVILFYKFKD